MHLRRFGWQLGKLILATAIVAVVGWQLVRDLNQLDVRQLHLRPGWLILSGTLYLLALGLSAWFWVLLLRRFGQQPEIVAALRAYYVGHLGKYLPGKAWALLLRAGLVHSPRVRVSAAIITSFYEVLTTMAAGALLAAVLFTLHPPTILTLEWSPVWLGLALLAVVIVPLLPGVFNWAVDRLTARFRQIETLQLPRLGHSTLLLGLGLTLIGWALLGLSLWALLQGLLPQEQLLTLERWTRYTSINALAYVAGFLVLVAPGGVGVREFFLLQLLPSELADQPVHAVAAVTALAVLVLRLVWTGAEILLAGLVWWFPGPSQEPMMTR